MASPIRMTGINSGLDTESIVTALTSGYKSKVDKYKQEQTKVSWKQDAWKGINKKVYSLYTSLDSMRFSANWKMQKATSSNTNKVTVTSNGKAFNGTQSLKITSLASTASYTGGVIDAKESQTMGELYKADDWADDATKTINVAGKDITIKKSDTLSSVISNIQNTAGVNASFDSAQKRIYLGAKTGGKGSIDVSGDDYLLQSLGLDANNSKSNAGKDAEIELNGVTYTGKSNNMTINGLSLQLYGTTGTDTVTISTQTDTQGIYDKIKNFFSTYNDVINDLTDSYNAESSKGYDPLTDDQKSAMSDTEVEKWEKKAKGGLLRNDDTLNSIMNSITNSMLGSYQIGDKKYSLASFGIKTKGILNAASNRQYEYHIDGDEDDESVSSNQDKLMAALNSDPDTVISFMQKLTSDLYTNLDKKMKRTTLKSAYTIYNDKEMASEYSSYTSLIKQWEDRLSTMEDSYYQKFSKMESTLSKLQSSTSSLTNSLR